MAAPAEHRVLILSAGVGAGHNSAGEAVRAAAAGRTDVEEVQLLDLLDSSTALYRDLLGKGYFTLVDSAPWLVEFGYDVTDRPFRRRGPIDPWTRANALPTIRAITRFRPTAIVCTHFLPAQLVAALLLGGRIDARTAVVTTDYDFQGLWLTSAFHAFSVAREEGLVQLTALGLPADRVVATGIPIRRAEVALHRAPAVPPRILVSAGAAGGDYAVAVVRQTMHIRTPCRITVVCGRNEELRRRIEQLVAPLGDRYEVLGFTDAMPRLLAEADLFVGKPGGLSASECMAAGLPMVLVNPIPGQEVRNGDYLMEQGAAIRCNTVQTIGWKIDEVLRTPGRLAAMRAAAAATGRPGAARDVLDGLLDGPERPLVVTRAAQRTILQASERRVVATDLTGRTSLARLTEAATGSTIALIRAEQLDDLREHFGVSGGGLRLRRERNPFRAGWEAHRLVRAVVREGEELAVEVQGLAAEDRALRV